MKIPCLRREEKAKVCISGGVMEHGSLKAYGVWSISMCCAIS